MRSSTRITNAAFAAKICSTEDAATTISDGDNIGMSGFTGGREDDPDRTRLLASKAAVLRAPRHMQP